MPRGFNWVKFQDVQFVHCPCNQGMICDVPKAVVCVLRLALQCICTMPGKLGPMGNLGSCDMKASCLFPGLTGACLAFSEQAMFAPHFVINGRSYGFKKF